MMGRGFLTGVLLAVFATFGAFTVNQDLSRTARDALQGAGMDWGPAFVAQPTSRLTGRPRIIDGDTLVVDGQKVRLVGIDAPEHDQRCGRRACGTEATNALKAVAAGRELQCSSHRYDDYGRALAVCRAGDRDLGAWMVRQGYAVAAYGNHYKAEQEAARRERVGLWQGPFDLPCKHRGTC